MFWDDIREIKTWLFKLEKKIDATNSKFDHFVENASTPEYNLESIEHNVEVIKELISDVFDLEEENNTINRLHDKLNEILRDEKRLEKVQLAANVGDKFDDYMKNVDKLNALVNEVKGVASMSRANLHDKNIDGLNRCMKEVLERAENVEKFMEEVNCTLFDILKKLKKKEPKKVAKKKKIISLSDEST